MLSRIRANFFTGLLIVVPLVLTFWVLYFIIDRLTFLLSPITNVLERLVPAAQNIEAFTNIMIFILLLVFLTLVGFAARIIVLRNIFGFGEKILYKVPMISVIYGTIKEIWSTLFINKNTIFQRVVLIEYPRKGVYQLGFVVSGTKGEVQQKTKSTLLNIFVPTTPNPTSGVLVFVPQEETVSLDMSVAEAMKMVVSGGAIVPRDANTRESNANGRE
ncbi:MAG: DUF502 domain-containing protein [Candidatus Omnitrophica bacterium]|nr:DUF502 domain-containing protein [Candidatus Omnitrophota bacterium]